MKPSLVRPFVLAALALALQQGSFAADDSSPAAPSQLSQARSLIKDKKWSEAIAELKRVNDTASADWNNLMGYSQRKAKTPDFDAAERYYNEALRIDPKHRGALEYSGELYLMKGDLATAEKRLAVLDKACTFGCDEYTDLKKAIERYKASGNKYVAGSYGS
ncbi:MAG TPA: tetratricopeptide repeat protein [Burkholderiaceae bacterium]|nr:tetratricopeptide repeat protein [Burkholderiaceae bacterium]